MADANVFGPPREKTPAEVALADQFRKTKETFHKVPKNKRTDKQKAAYKQASSEFDAARTQMRNEADSVGPRGQWVAAQAPAVRAAAIARAEAALAQAKES